MMNSTDSIHVHMTPIPHRSRRGLVPKKIWTADVIDLGLSKSQNDTEDSIIWTDSPYTCNINLPWVIIYPPTPLISSTYNESILVVDSTLDISTTTESNMTQLAILAE